MPKSRVGDGQGHNPFDLTDYLHLAEVARRSVVLRVIAGGTEQGWIVVVEGTLWSAQSRSSQGEQAIIDFLLLKPDSIRAANLESPVGQQQISKTAQQILLEFTKAKDEANRYPDQRKVI